MTGVIAVATPAFYTVKEMAVLYRRSIRWVYGHAERLPGVTREFGGLLFLKAAVDAALLGK